MLVFPLFKGTLDIPNVQTPSVPERAQCAQQAENSEDAQDPVPSGICQRDQNVHQRHKHQDAIQNVPAGLKVALLPKAESERYHLEHGSTQR